MDLLDLPFLKDKNEEEVRHMSHRSALSVFYCTGAARTIIGGIHPYQSIKYCCAAEPVFQVLFYCSTWFSNVVVLLNRYFIPGEFSSYIVYFVT